MLCTPVFDIGLPVSAPWLWLVRALVCLGLIVTLLWWAGPAAPGDAGLRLALVVTAGACCVVAWGPWFSRPCRLRLDGAGWALSRQPGQWLQGRLAVALDLGPLMLLRFEVGTAPGRGRCHWLAVDRGSLGGPWHALRCAVYSPPPRRVTGPPG